MLEIYPSWMVKPYFMFDFCVVSVSFCSCLLCFESAWPNRKWNYSNSLHASQCLLNNWLSCLVVFNLLVVVKQDFTVDCLVIVSDSYLLPNELVCKRCCSEAAILLAFFAIVAEVGLAQNNTYSPPPWEIQQRCWNVSVFFNYHLKVSFLYVAKS